VEVPVLDARATRAFAVARYIVVVAGQSDGLAVDAGKPIGLPSDEDYIARYCERTGRAHIEHWNFYLVFCFFRLAAILQGVKKRALIGTASSAEAEARGAMVEPLAELGLRYIEAA
ncbi:MAG: phosphotransferase family protein, partial [Pseudomonadota bacterium]